METNKRAFATVTPGHYYAVPEYKVTEGVGIEPTGNMLPFVLVRGSKVEGENKTEPRAGSLHEHYLSVMIADLQLKYAEVSDRETACAITKLQEAQHWLEERAANRAAAGVLGTYQPHKSVEI